MIKVPRPTMIKTIKAMQDITQKWYADCYNTEADMQRLILYEMKLRKLVDISIDKQL